MPVEGRAGSTGASERFEILAKLGTGGMGVVYRARDRERHTEIALKVLRGVSGRDVYRFKREFRALADVAHPNLVGLYELHTVGDAWCITMELVDGVPFIDWLRPRAAGVAESPPTPAPTPLPETPSDVTTETRTVPPQAPVRVRGPIAAPLRAERLEGALYQLCDTVHALHSAGKLHRDLKPSNVLVEASGRVVVLDFGLVAELGAAELDHTHEAESAVGTPAYMSPEQAADRPLTRAADWYAVGVMLYEALTGRRPYDLQRSGQPVLPPGHFAADAPAHLSALCMQLLGEDPESRPSGEAILAALGREPSEASRELAVSLQAVPFVGRDKELVRLHEAFTRVQAGQGSAVFVHADSGMGKSTLLRRFRDELTSQVPDLVVLRGRCFERETMPFKSLDTVVDALSGVLLGVPAGELDALLPADAWALARLFPATRRVPAIGESVLHALGSADPLEVRRRAFAALRALLVSLAGSAPIVLELDDLQWGDPDSGQFLADLLEHGGGARILCVLAHREGADDSPLLAALARARSGPGHGEGMVSEDLPLAPLSSTEARALVRLVGGTSDPARAREVVRDAGGSPLFLAELMRAGPGKSLDDSVRARVARLPEEARRLVELCATVARPLLLGLALRVAGLGGGKSVAVLRSERLLRVRRAGNREAEVETYHDRVRAAIVGGLSAERQAELHRALAEILEEGAGDDHEALVGHWLGAGEPARAASHAVAAAAAAEERLAFHRAADLYGLALTQLTPGAEEAEALRLRMGHAMVHAGRLGEAAELFARAAEIATSPAGRLECQRLELEQRLRCGQLDAGLALANQLLAGLGLHVPRSRGGVLVAVLRQRFLLRFSKQRVDEQAKVDLPPVTRERLRLLNSLSNGLAFVNPLYGRAIQTRFLREALASRDPRQVGKAWCFEVGYLSAAGGPSHAAASALAARTAALGDRLGDVRISGHARAAAGLADSLSGRFRAAQEHLLAGEARLREAGAGVRWELDLTEFFRVAAAWNLGQAREVVRLVGSYLRDADERGDVYAQRGHRGWRGNLAWLLVGHPEEARAQLAAVEDPLREGQDAQVGHYYEMVSACHIDLYLGDGAAAHARVEALWPAFGRALLTRVQAIDIEGHFLRGRAALAAAGLDAGLRASLLALCEKRLRATEMPWARAFADTLAAGRARIAAADGDEVGHLRAAHAGFAACDMRLYEAACAGRLGELLAGDEGAHLRLASATRFGEEEVADPSALSRVLIGRGV